MDFSQCPNINCYLFLQTHLCSMADLRNSGRFDGMQVLLKHELKMKMMQLFAEIFEKKIHPISVGKPSPIIITQFHNSILVLGKRGLLHGRINMFSR